MGIRHTHARYADLSLRMAFLPGGPLGMRYLFASLLVALLTLGSAGCRSAIHTTISPAKQSTQGKTMREWTVPSYPDNRAEPLSHDFFGTTVADPYRWLEEGTKPEVQAWMTEQDGLTRTLLASISSRKPLTERLEALYYVEAIGIPTSAGGRLFYRHRAAQAEKGILYCREADGVERVLIDPNTLSDDGNIALGRWEPSRDGRHLAYVLKPNNADRGTLYVMDVDSGTTSTVDVISGARYASPQWTPAGDGFYYTRLPVDDTIPMDQLPGHAAIYFHRLGTAPSNDALLYPQTNNPQTFLSPSVSHDGRWLFVTIQKGWNATDIYFRDLSDPRGTFQPFAVGLEAITYVQAWKDHFYLTTNLDAAHYRLLRTPVTHPDRAHWEEIVPERDQIVIESASIYGGQLVLKLLDKAASRLEIRSMAGGLLSDVVLPDIGEVGYLSGAPDQEDFYYTFSSFTVPQRIYRRRGSTGDAEIWSQVNLPVDPSPYMVEQVWYASKDGTPISMFIVRRRDVEQDGTSPVLLYGYGGFNVTLGPSFLSSIYPWLEAGGIYAVPNLRGGGEYGEAWHKAGMGQQKQNTFDDFIAAAEYLIAEHYTRPDRLVLKGGSNGGLLVGAVMTQRPELAAGVICAVPLLDMIRYHLFGSGRTWIPEYGSAEDEAQFKTLYSYSPYHHVRKGQRYPALLMLSAANDDRVDPLHARKMVAALQDATPDGPPQLLRIERRAGHGGAGLVKVRVSSAADMLAFAMNVTGLTYTGPKESSRE